MVVDGGLEDGANALVCTMRMVTMKRIVDLNILVGIGLNRCWRLVLGF